MEQRIVTEQREHLFWVGEVVIPGNIQMIDCFGVGSGTQERFCAPGWNWTFAGPVGNGNWFSGNAFKPTFDQMTVSDDEGKLHITVGICSFSPKEFSPSVSRAFGLIDTDVMCSGHPVSFWHRPMSSHKGRGHFDAFWCVVPDMLKSDSCNLEPVSGLSLPHNACIHNLYSLPLVAEQIDNNLFSWSGDEPSRSVSTVGFTSLLYQWKNHISTGS